MRILSFFASVFHVTTLTSAMHTAYMDQYCGRTKDIGGTAAIQIKLTADSSYRPNMDCIFKVTGDFSNEDRLMIQFIDLELHYTCDGDWLSLYEGVMSSNSTIGPRKFCGWPKPSYIYTTIRSELTFYFHSGDEYQDQGFTIILTHFQSGKCDGTSEIKCDNGRCVAATLACNGYNPCGDHSDCPLGTGGIAGIALGSVAFVIICVIVVAAARGRLYLFRRRGVAMATTSTTAMPMSSSQGYIQTAPQQLTVPTAPAMYPGQNLGQNLGQNTGQNMGQNMGQHMGQNMGQNTAYTPPSKYSTAANYAQAF